MGLFSKKKSSGRVFVDATPRARPRKRRGVQAKASIDFGLEKPKTKAPWEGDHDWSGDPAIWRR